MVDQVHRGNRKKNFFNRKAWKCICHEFYSKTGLKWDKEQLKNRYSVLRRHYAVVKSLLERSDFSCDQSTGTIVASDEGWSEYIQGHADAETIRSSGCPLYKQLYSIFSEPRSAEFEGGVCSSLHCLEKPLSITIHEDTSSESEKVDDDMVDDPDFQPATPSSTVVLQKRGRKRMDDDAIAGSTCTFNHGNNRYTIANCIKELDGMQGVQKQVYFAALDLFNNPNARETFLSLEVFLMPAGLSEVKLENWSS